MSKKSSKRSSKRSSSPWITYVKSVAKSNGISYKEALN